MRFIRTLRVPDDGKTYPLPPGLGSFPMARVDDHAARVPEAWRTHGGVMLPMYASEAMWLSFEAPSVPGHAAAWPFALKVAAGKINAVDGAPWSTELSAGQQDWVAVPKQPWLDGFFATKGSIRQFVAMELGRGYSVEEQLTGAAEHGGVQLVAYPMRADEFERRFPKLPPDARGRFDDAERTGLFAPMPAAPAPDMGLGAGGKMVQDIVQDPYGTDVYDRAHSSRCFVHLCNSLAWRHITGLEPPTTPFTAADYERAGLPWYEHHVAGAEAVSGPSWLDKIKSVFALGEAKGESPLPENESLTPSNVIQLKGQPPDEVREGDF